MDTLKRESTMSGRIGLDIRKMFFFRGCQALGQLPREWSHPLGLPEIQDGLDNVLRDKVGLLGCPGKPQELDQ